MSEQPYDVLHAMQDYVLPRKVQEVLNDINDRLGVLEGENKVLRDAMETVRDASVYGEGMNDQKSAEGLAHNSGTINRVATEALKRTKGEQEND